MDSSKAKGLARQARSNDHGFDQNIIMGNRKRHPREESVAEKNIVTGIRKRLVTRRISSVATSIAIINIANIVTGILGKNIVTGIRKRLVSRCIDAIAKNIPIDIAN
jgi:hypothetical protein